MYSFRINLYWKKTHNINNKLYSVGIIIDLKKKQKKAFDHQILLTKKETNGIYGVAQGTMCKTRGMYI